MRQFVLTIILLSGTPVFFGTQGSLLAQKSKVIAAYQLIETEKFEEAKEMIEQAKNDDKTWAWPQTWHARGLLCQTAYQKGLDTKDAKKCQLYPDQLYVAFDSYENARKFDRTGKMEEQLAPLYILLANKLLDEGEKKYDAGKYKDALKAYEHVIEIKNLPFLAVEMDTNLIFNASLAAYNGRDWDKAIRYLKDLSDFDYSAEVPHLLYASFLGKKDTLEAELALIDGIHRYEKNEELVLLRVDLFLKTDSSAKAIEVLDTAAMKHPGKYIFPYSKGLVYEHNEQYDQAIKSYKEALELAPDELQIYVNIGTCYYNTGVRIQERARLITNNRAFREEKAKSEAAFESARKWLNQAREKDPHNEKVIRLLSQLKS